MIRTIVFDFGNVLAFFDHGRALRQLVRHTDQTAEQLLELVYHDDLMYRYERGEVTTAELFGAGCRVGGLRCTQDEFVAAFCDIFWHNPPMEELIPRLKRNGYRLVVASNTNAAHYAHFRDSFRDVLAHFDAIAVSHEASARKPHTKFFEYAHGFAGCARGECLFVDDVAENVTGARDFGWQAIRYTKFDELIPELRQAGVRVE
jgi:HAD superfamily hydrolase (TIGR01549 family)